MSFIKVGSNDYTSPSGRHWTKKQITAYYSSNGFKESIPKVDGRKTNAR